jgi:hypothetical protein
MTKKKNSLAKAIDYAHKNGIIYSDEEEEIFKEDPDLAVRYATVVKKGGLSKKVEEAVFDHYCNLLKESKKDQVSKLHMLIKYVKITKYIPEKYVKKLLRYLSPENYYLLSSCTEIRLPEKFEKKMFEKIKKTNNLWAVTEYQYAIGTKISEEMHNYMILKSLENKSYNDNNATTAYFLNMKKLKSDLVKLSSGFDKNMTLQQVIDEL